jgi:hypothetical protein
LPPLLKSGFFIAKRLESSRFFDNLIPLHNRFQAGLFEDVQMEEKRKSKSNLNIAK